RKWTVAVVPNRARASRRMCSDFCGFAMPCLASVMSFSTNGRTSFALATVVIIRSFSNSASVRLRNIAWRWLALRPSVRPALRCLMAVFLPKSRYAASGLAPYGRRQFHSQLQAALLQFGFHFLQRGFAEVSHFQQFLIGADHQITNRGDAFRLQAIGGPHRQ